MKDLLMFVTIAFILFSLHLLHMRITGLEHIVREQTAIISDTHKIHQTLIYTAAELHNRYPAKKVRK